MKQILKHYAYYYDSLQRLGSFPLARRVSLDDLGLTRGEVQAGYKEKKELVFEGNLIDYLCWISTQYLASLSPGNGAVETAEFIIKSYENHASDVKNTLRLIERLPLYFFSIVPDNKEAFLKLSGFWFDLYKAGK